MLPDPVKQLGSPYELVKCELARQQRCAPRPLGDDPALPVAIDDP